MNLRKAAFLTFIAITAPPMLSGCLSGGGEPESGNINAPGDTSGNSAPTIAGAPKSSVKVGESYSFTPSATDPDGDSISFAIENLPGWAAFDAANGSLSGTPDAGDVGTYQGIQITVSDSAHSTSLAQFSISVTQSASGSTTLSWNPPTQNDDGSPLVDLAGYNIYYGESQGNYPNKIEIDNPGITTYVVDNLSPDTYFFVSTAVNSNGDESRYSNVATKTVN